MRDSWCGELGEAQVGEQLRVAGWVHRRRDHGGLIFIDLRDRTGLLQLVFHPETDAELFALAERLRPEHVISAAGELVLRDPENVNPEMATGKVELAVESCDHLATSQTPPFPIDEDGPVEETIRLQYRWLDLRRQAMAEAITTRSRVVSTMRRVLEGDGFVEIETPVLTRSTPEGARDFLVPSRMSPGDWYALPQSPQLFKQLLMFAGFERYYQVARCFRDEDLRADRQPEFTQLDIEMSFVGEEDVIALSEAVMGAVFETVGFELPAPPWERIPWDEAMLRYGSDRPDRRFGLEIVDVSDALRGSEFKVFQSVLDDGGVVRALNAGRREMSRSELDSLNEVVQRHGAKAVAPIVAGDGGWTGNLAKFFSDEQVAAANAALEAGDGDLLCFVADTAEVAPVAIGALRLDLAGRFDLVDASVHDACWVVDFPMFEEQDGGGLTALHHPFTAPLGDLDDPAALRSRAYDLTVDGVEIGGGSIRIHTPEVQQKVFEIIGLPGPEARERFGFLLDALSYGAPPHGGIAFGLDRIVALACGRESIRDVIAFPKTASGADPLTGAPGPAESGQLRDLGLKTIAPPPADS
ncbi:MAG: aspartate--tRNA ligase [Solirubrobacterales bacterium]